MNRYIITPDNDNSAVSQIGGKGLNLRKLIEAGFPVPETYYLTAEAFGNASGLILQKSEQEVNSPKPEKPDLSFIRESFCGIPHSSPIYQQLNEEISGITEKSGTETLFAVRSSASAEDLPNASFAGQYESFLNVKGNEEIIKSIFKCWASVWTDRAWNYRRKNNIPETSLTMAVIIQKMVPADFSGVIFTADPVTGDGNRIIIEMVKGLGDELVSGRAAPFAAGFDKNTHPRQILTEHNIPLTEVLLEKLIQTALSIEKHFGSPQDIEWAFAGNELFILQSRNITTGGTSDGYDIWSSVNVGELMPGVLTPLAFDIASESVKGLFFFVANLLKIDFGSQPFIALAGGRAYANITTFTRLLTCMPGLSKMELRDSFGGMQSRQPGGSPLPDNVIEMLPKSPPITPEEKAKRKKASLSALIAMPGIMAKLLFNLIFVDEDKFLRNMRAEVDKAMRTDVKSLSDEQLRSIITGTVSGAMKGSDLLLQVAGMGMGLSTTLFQLCEKWLGDSTGSIPNKLLSGSADMESANGAMELWNLAETAHNNSSVRDVIIKGSFSTVMEKLGNSNEGRDFIQLWDSFMFSHGHHARGEVNIYTPRWAEEPDYVLDLIRNCMKSMDKHNPAKIREERAKEKEALLSQCLKKIRNPINRLIFKIVVSKSLKGLELRENLKSQWMRAFFPLRKSILESGVRLVKSGKIEQQEDVFFLYLNELGELLQSGKPETVKEIIANRKAAFEENRYLSPAPVISGKYNPEDFTVSDWENSPLQLIQTPMPVMESDGKKQCHILKGIAVCPGIAEGPARVILSADDHQQVLPGEILIAPFTDPGWTPYFLTAAALITDMGGMLSHGSIVAREYGLPAVVNTGSATKLIKTGQQIRVDGTAGKVYVYSEDKL
ncbi:MAG: hypothetical protein LWY06_08730 [Firmicutes bacterium]|nr:hypothetical protein [Bacillota bacterium]